MALHPAERKILEKLSARNILELGCGKGYTVDDLLKFYDNVFGIDPVLNLLKDEETLEHFGETDNFYIAIARGDGLPFPESSFDGIFSHWAIHHYRYPLAVLSEAHRTLTPGGWLYIADGISYTSQELTPQQENHLHFHEIAVAADRFMKNDHFPLRQLEDIAQLIKRAKFTVEYMEVVVAENPEDARTEENYIDSYVKNLQTMRKKLEEFKSADGIIKKIDRLIDSLKSNGLRIAPFAAIVARKRK